VGTAGDRRHAGVRPGSKVFVVASLPTLREPASGDFCYLNPAGGCADRMRAAFRDQRPGKQRRQERLLHGMIRRGLRTYAGGSSRDSVEGYLGDQANAAPPLIVSRVARVGHLPRW